MTDINGIPLIDIVLPVIGWVILLGYYVYQFTRRARYKNISLHDNATDVEGFKYYPTYFYQMRGGWVRKNFLTGQGSANSTRDYLRVLLFFAGNCAVMAMIFVGYASSFYDPNNGSSRDHFFAFKLAFTSFVFMTMFYLFLYSTRYATQFHFLMNVKEANDVAMNLNIIEKVFHKSYFYFAAGLRMYFIALPLFAWFLSSIAMIIVVPVVIYLVEDYENYDFLEGDLEEMYKGAGPLAKPAFRAYTAVGTGEGDLEMGAKQQESSDNTNKKA